MHFPDGAGRDARTVPHFITESGAVGGFSSLAIIVNLDENAGRRPDELWYQECCSVF
jgi:hypothetical protein